VVVLASLSVAEPPPRVKVAHDLARAHAAWPQGRDWLAANLRKADQAVIPVLNRCLPDTPDDDGELTPFTTYLRLSQKGRVLEVLTDIDAELGHCMTTEARDVQLPAAPREDFWIQLNLAASL
jgi:hypothetical protein